MLLNTPPSIIALHYVSDDAKLEPLKPWVISHQSFVRLLDYLETEQYATLTFEDLEQGKGQNAKYVVITFDDCPKHLFDFAIPELLKRKMKAVFYISTAYLGGYNVWGVADGKPRLELMDEADVKRLHDMGMEIGSHGHRHIMLDEFETDEVTHELARSKSVLEAIVQKPVLTVAYPYGFVPVAYKKIIPQLQFRLGLSVYTRFDSKYAIRRWVYDDEHDEKKIKWKMSLLYRLYRPFSDKLTIAYKRYSSLLYRTYASVKSRVIAFAGFTYIGIEDVLVTL